MNLPVGFLNFISKYEQLASLAQSLLTEPEVSVRFNRRKLLPDSSSEVVNAALSGSVVPWCADGFYLSDRPKFTFDPALHQGVYYVQDASSMAISAVLRQIAPAPVRFLDACAAPGGKTTAAISALSDSSLIVANEYDYKRAEILAENIAKWGNDNVVVTRGDTAKFLKLKNFFDIVAVDAPCSGEGMMRKEVKASQQWSEGLVADCAALQRQIISNVWSAIRPGGYLIYSTCTFNTSENEDNVRWILDNFDAESVRIDLLDNILEIVKGIDIDAHCYRFIPGRVRGEGLFLAVIRKSGDATAAPVKKLRSKPLPILKNLSDWLTVPAELLLTNDNVYALPEPLAPEMSYLASVLDTLSVGLWMATIKGRDIIPTHNLALSNSLARDAFPNYDVSKADAIKFLQRDNISLTDFTQKGYVLLVYDGLPLGFVKNLGNRSNNLLPKNWRILSKL